MTIKIKKIKIIRETTYCTLLRSLIFTSVLVLTKYTIVFVYTQSLHCQLYEYVLHTHTHTHRRPNGFSLSPLHVF